MKVLVQKELSAQDIQKELFTKHGILTIASYEGNAELRVPRVSVGSVGVAVHLDHTELATILEAGDRLVVRCNNETNYTPSDFKMELDNILQWMGRAVVDTYKSYTIGSLYMMYLYYHVNRLLTPEHPEIYELATSVLRQYELGYDSDDDTLQLVQGIVDRIAPIIKGYRTPKGNDEDSYTFYNFFHKLFLSTFFISCMQGAEINSRAHLNKITTAVQELIKIDLMITSINDTDTSKATKLDFDEFEKDNLDEVVQNYIASNFFSIQTRL